MILDQFVGVLLLSEEIQLLIVKHPLDRHGKEDELQDGNPKILDGVLGYLLVGS